MHAVGGIADQGQAVADVAFGQMQRQGIRPAPAAKLDRADCIAATSRQFGIETVLVRGHQRGRRGRPLAPHQGRAPALERQHGKGPGRQEALVCDALVRFLVAHRADDADLVVAPAAEGDAGSLTSRRMAAVGGYQQAGAQASAVAEFEP